MRSLSELVGSLRIQCELLYWTVSWRCNLVYFTLASRASHGIWTLATLGFEGRLFLVGDLLRNVMFSRFTLLVSSRSTQTNLNLYLVELFDKIKPFDFSFFPIRNYTLISVITLPIICRLRKSLSVHGILISLWAH